jgi:hypothetical protein
MAQQIGHCQIEMIQDRRNYLRIFSHGGRMIRYVRHPIAGYINGDSLNTMPSQMAHYRCKLHH